MATRSHRSFGRRVDPLSHLEMIWATSVYGVCWRAARLHRNAGFDDDHLLRTADASSLDLVGEKLQAHGKRVTSLGYSSDSANLVSASTDASIHVWGESISACLMRAFRLSELTLICVFHWGRFRSSTCNILVDRQHSDLWDSERRLFARWQEHSRRIIGWHHPALFCNVRHSTSS